MVLEKLVYVSCNHAALLCSRIDVVKKYLKFKIIKLIILLS